MSKSASAKPKNTDDQLARFKRAARESGADMSKKEFSRVLGKLLKAKPKPGKSRSSKS